MGADAVATAEDAAACVSGAQAAGRAPGTAPVVGDEDAAAAAREQEAVDMSDEAVNHREASEARSQIATAVETMSFHRRISIILDVFDFDQGIDGDDSAGDRWSVEAVAFPLMIEAVEAHRHGFHDIGHALYAAEQRRLVTRRGGRVTLTMLGRCYHVGYQNPAKAFTAIAERRAAVLRKQLGAARARAALSPAGADDDDDGGFEEYEEEEEEEIDDADEN